MPVNLCSRERVLRVLPIGQPDADTNTLLDDLIRGVTLALEQRMDRWVEQTSRTEQRDVEFAQSQFSLRGYPVTAQPVVKFDATRAFGGSITAWATSLYWVPLNDDERSVMHFDSVGAVGRGVMEVVYTGGLGTFTGGVETSFPDLADACAFEVANLYQRRETLSMQQSVSGSDAQQYVQLKILPYTQEVVAARRRMAYGLV